MKTTVQWIDEANAKLQTNDYKLSKALGISTSLMSAYRHQRQTISENHAIKLGELMGIDPMPIVAAAAYERSKADHIKAFWARHAETVTTAVAVVLVGGTLLTAPPPVYAGGNPVPVDITGQDIHCSKYRRRRKRTSADRWVREITGHLPGFFSSSRSASHSHD